MCSSETQVSNQNIQLFSEMGILSFWWFTMLANCGNNMFCRQRREEKWVNSGGSSSRVLAASKVQPFSKSMKEGCCFAQGENIDHIFFNILDWALQYSADNLLRKMWKEVTKWHGKNYYEGFFLNSQVCSRTNFYSISSFDIWMAK